MLLLTKLALADESCPILCTHHSLGLTEAVNAKCSLLSALCFIFFYLHGVASSVLNQIPFYQKSELYRFCILFDQNVF